MANPAAALLELRNVSVVRGDNLALDRMSLRIEQGEHLCVLGPNGCGKSTLIKTLTRECYPLAREDSGIQILGHIDKSEGVVKTQNSGAVFFSPRFVQSWWRTEAL